MYRTRRYGWERVSNKCRRYNFGATDVLMRRILEDTMSTSNNTNISLLGNVFHNPLSNILNSKRVLSL